MLHIFLILHTKYDEPQQTSIFQQDSTPTCYHTQVQELQVLSVLQVCAIDYIQRH